jgi:hypothetical protein
MATPKKTKKDVSGGLDYPSGRKGGSENVWNFQESYEKPAVIPSMRKSLSGFIGRNSHS